jgi:hypothetical protein
MSKNMTLGYSNIFTFIIAHICHLEKFHSTRNMQHGCDSRRYGKNMVKIAKLCGDIGLLLLKIICLMFKQFVARDRIF